MRRFLHDLGFEDIEISYYGKTISELKEKSILNEFISKVRTKLIGWNIVAPFAFLAADSGLQNPLERAVLAPFKAHIQSSEPAWWLRAVARKI